MRTFIFSVVLCAAASAQVGGPFLGYVPDGTRIRPMYGLPAAGAVAPAIASRDFSHIAAAPQKYFAVVSAADTGEVLVAQDELRGGFAFTSIPGASANPDMLVLSPGGTSASLWFPSTNHLQTVSGLPNSPAVRDIDAAFLNASPQSIAISDDGQWAAALFSGAIYAFGPNGEVIPLQTDPGVMAIAFFHNNHTLALATANRAISIADVGGSTAMSILFDYSAQPLSPRGIGVSFDNQRVVIADISGTVVNIAAGTATANLTDCGCSPTGLYGMGGAVFRLNGFDHSGRGGPRTELKLFDATTGAVLIVPPALSLAGGRQ